ncbi:MAG TPA: hypothetical protein VJT73_00490 [Polyangiaceae bacterium]|nr:hypothetical protein [Polyangiaceae bacterium]
MLARVDASDLRFCARVSCGVFLAAIAAGCGSSDVAGPSKLGDPPFDFDAQVSPSDARSAADRAAVDAADSGEGAGGSRSDSAPGDEMTERDGSPDASTDDDAAEPMPCLEDGGGPSEPPKLVAPTGAAGVCAATLGRQAASVVREGDFMRFVGLTPDARTIAWFETHTLNYADRAAATSAWGPGFSVDGVKDEVPDRPMLSPDGLRIVFVRDDRHGLAEVSRVDRTSRFGSQASETQFAAINALGLMLGPNEWIGSPVLSSDDRSLFYVRGEGIDGRHDAVYLSRRVGDVSWPIGAALRAPELEASCGRHRRPTGLSSDGLTLFYWDEVSGTERATFRAGPDAVFAGAVDLGAAADAVPNPGCSAMVFTPPGGGISSAPLIF